MTQIFTEEGKVVPVTVVESGNNVVIQNKTVESDGYNAVQLGFGEVKENKVNKPLKGHFEKAGVSPVKFIREMRLADASEYKVGDTIGVDIFSAGELVDVRVLPRARVLPAVSSVTTSLAVLWAMAPSPIVSRVPRVL